MQTSRTLYELLRAQLEQATPEERLRFFARLQKGYCTECGISLEGDKAICESCRHAMNDA